jgi:hypothetical protein
MILGYTASCFPRLEADELILSKLFRKRKRGLVRWRTEIGDVGEGGKNSVCRRRKSREQRAVSRDEPLVVITVNIFFGTTSPLEQSEQSKSR